MGRATLYAAEAPSFRPAFWQELARRNPFGLELTERQVKDWFYLCKWPRYSTYRYKRHATMISRWWANARLAEVRDGALIRLRLEAGDHLVIVPERPPVDEQPQERLPRAAAGELVALDSIFEAFATPARRT